ATVVPVSNIVSYTMFVTNFSTVTIPAVVVSNQFSGPVTILSATNSLGLTFTNTNAILFSLGPLVSGQSAQMTAIVQPLQAGQFTNTVTAAAPSTSVSNTISNVVITVTNVITRADLSVSVSGPASNTFIGDPMTIITTVTNGGPNSASTVSVTNSF